MERIMPSHPRTQLTRTPSWPSTLHLATTTAATTDVPNKSHTTESESGCTRSAAPVPSRSSHYSVLDDDDDSEAHPEDHFLSPMLEYDVWASDDSDGEDEDQDDDGGEWDAGITDFALFDSERRQAKETHKQLDNRWMPFMQSQQSALSRAVLRTRSDSVGPDTSRPPLPFEDEIPDLTPDSSPHLRDDLDMPSADHHDSTSSSMLRIPNYLTVTITPPPPVNTAQPLGGEVNDLPLAASKHRRSQSTQPPLPHRRLERPGLRHARTMSGKLHSWRRPGWNIYPLGEEREAECRAEHEEAGDHMSQSCRGT